MLSAISLLANEYAASSDWPTNYLTFDPEHMMWNLKCDMWILTNYEYHMNVDLLFKKCSMLVRD